jgi:Arc/MetJ family transcription regulator
VSRTNIDIDDALMVETMKATGQTTKKGAVEAAMREVVRVAALRDLIEGMRGIEWDGDLEEMRRDFEVAKDTDPFDPHS